MLCYLDIKEDSKKNFVAAHILFPKRPVFCYLVRVRVRVNIIQSYYLEIIKCSFGESPIDLPDSPVQKTSNNHLLNIFWSIGDETIV